MSVCPLLKQDSTDRRPWRWTDKQTNSPMCQPPNTSNATMTLLQYHCSFWKNNPFYSQNPCTVTEQNKYVLIQTHLLPISFPFPQRNHYMSYRIEDTGIPELYNYHFCDQVFLRIKIIYTLKYFINSFIILLFIWQ